jgi:pectate lyase
VLCGLIGLIAPPASALPDAPPLIGVGFGATATGGKGGPTVHVTTLADAGPGSLREAVAESGRMVVFDVAGTIALRSELHIASDITLDGATAPDGGITFSGQAVSLSGSHNVVARYLRLRQGPKSGKHKSSLEISKGTDMLFDHLSVEWGRWDCIDMNGCKNITIQNCLIGEGIGPQRFGCLCGSDNITFFQNLFIDNQSRNPKAKGKVQFLNNVVYNWGVTGFVGGHSAADHYADIVGNYFIKGPSSSDRFAGEFALTDHVYQTSNLFDGNRNGVLDGRPVVPGDLSLLTPTAAPFASLPDGLVTAEQAYARVVAEAGDCRPRDAVDARLIGYLTSLGRDGHIVGSGEGPDGPIVDAKAGGK